MIVISFNNERLNDPSANYRFNVWKYFGCKIVNINGTETTDKDKTICKICVNDASYGTLDQQHVNPSSRKTWDYMKFLKFQWTQKNSLVSNESADFSDKDWSVVS
jgi:hypothetical protein